LERTGFYKTDEKIPSGQLDWKFKSDYGFCSSPVISQRVVYVNCAGGNLYSVGTNSGQTKWVFNREKWVGAAPTIFNNVVYVSGLDHFLYAVNAKTGVENWRFEAGDMIMSSPAISDRKIYFGSYDGFLYALDIDTGQEKWKFKTEGNGQPLNTMPQPDNVGDLDYYFDLGAIVSDPTISTGVVYFSSYDGYLYALDANTGAEKWKFITNGEPANSIPVVSNETIYYAGTDGYFYAIDNNGQLKWKFATEDPIWSSLSSAAVANGMVYFVNSFNHSKSFHEKYDQYSYFLYAVTEETGQMVWKSELPTRVIWITVSNNFLYFGDSAGFVFAFNANTGKEQWKYQAESSIYSEVVISEGKIYFCTEDGNLYALR
jgi:outer membrane protein assembly factor BamB